MTLSEMRDRFFEAAATKEGTRCEVCDRYGKIYVRKINATMAVALIRLFRLSAAHPGQRWFHYDTFTETRNEYEKLQFWGLIEHKANDDPETRDSGFWAITDRGVAFARQRITLPEKAKVYDSQVRGFTGRDVRISQVLGNKFNYAELMGEAAATRPPDLHSSPDGRLF